MLKTKVETNKLSAISLTDDVDKLCQPLKEQAGLVLFNYIQSTRKGMRFILSNEKSWFKYYFDLKHYEYEMMNQIDKVPVNYANFSLWDGCSDEHESCKIYSAMQKDLQIGYVLFLFAFYQDFAESFAFGISNEISHSSQVVLKNLDVFKRFAQYFKDKGKNLIQTAKSESFQVISSKESYSNPFIWGMKDEQKANLFEALSIERIYLKNEYAKVYFTVAEAKTVLLAIRGFTYDEIAKKLDVSTKTIDYRMNQIRNKMNLKHKKDVINTLVKGHYVELLEISI